MVAVSGKTFYLETFGCQMNVHDSEKVVGTLMARGYTQVEPPKTPSLSFTTRAAFATRPSRRLFHPLAAVQARRRQGQDLRRAGCRAQQEGERIFDRAPHVSLVAGSASYPQLEELCRRDSNPATAGVSPASAYRRTRPSTTPFAHRDSPYRASITVIEGCDKQCALLRGAFSRAAGSAAAPARA